MTQDFYRRIDGYNFPFEVHSSSNLARNAILTQAAPAGPGRIEVGRLFFGDVDPSTPIGNLLTLVVDTVTVFSASIGSVFGLLDVAVPTPWCSRQTGATYTQIHWKLNFDYESSASISIQNITSPDPCNFYLGFIGRVGR
jgi:hypothetical protein